MFTEALQRENYSDDQFNIVKTKKADEIMEDCQHVMNDIQFDIKEENEEPNGYVHDDIEEGHVEEDLGNFTDFWSESLDVKKEKFWPKFFSSPSHQQEEEDDDDIPDDIG